MRNNLSHSIYCFQNKIKTRIGTSISSEVVTDRQTDKIIIEQMLMQMNLYQKIETFIFRRSQENHVSIKPFQTDT